MRRHHIFRIVLATRMGTIQITFCCVEPNACQSFPCYNPSFRIGGPEEGVSFVIPTLFVVPTKAGIQTLENLKLSPHRVPTTLSQQGFSEV